MTFKDSSEADITYFPYLCKLSDCYSILVDGYMENRETSVMSFPFLALIVFVFKSSVSTLLLMSVLTVISSRAS